jgi:ankyrin repeat protein
VLSLSLLASGAGLSKALAAAARAGGLAKVKALIAQGADPNSLDDRGFTPTSGAVFYGKKDVVKYLLQNGADVNKNSKDGSTALIQASFRENGPIVKLLLEYEADVNKNNSLNGWYSGPLFSDNSLRW